jgi:hypothetical protein
MAPYTLKKCGAKMKAKCCEEAKVSLAHSPLIREWVILSTVEKLTGGYNPNADHTIAKFCPFCGLNLEELKQ